jgi:hypothetical protein
MFLAPALAAIGGGSVAAGGLVAGSTAAGIYSSVKGSDTARKSANQASDAAKASQVDINKLDEQTRAIAKKNAEDSAALEASMTPEVPQLRTAANQAVLGGIGGNANQEQLANFVMGRFGQPAVGNGTLGQINTPLLNEAIAKARSDLALGGQLSLDQRNEATRRGAAQSGRMTGRLGMGRDLSARDLGLTSYGVEQQRFQNAAGLSQQELAAQQLGLGRDTTLLNFGLNRDIANNQNYLSQFGALNSYYNNLRQQDLAAASYGQSIAPPVVGLDPSAVANLYVANQNNATIAAQNSSGIKAQSGQNQTNFGGQLLGYGLGNMTFGNSTQPYVPTATNSVGFKFS